MLPCAKAHIVLQRRATCSARSPVHHSGVSQSASNGTLESNRHSRAAPTKSQNFVIFMMEAEAGVTARRKRVQFNCFNPAP